jgi:DNA-binding Xre family transcriptional regulator
MSKKRAYRNERRTQGQVARDRALREKYQSERPSLESLVASGEYSAPLPQGEFLSLMEFASAIRAIRQRLEMSLSDLSEVSGIDKAALSRLESGQAENPTYSTLERVANALGKRLRLALEDERVNT